MGVCVSTDFCSLPLSLDWGAVSKGRAATRTLELKNPTNTEIVATIADVTGDSGAFTSASRTIAIPVESSRNVDFVFAPTDSKDYLASVSVRAAELCPAQVISLSGSGVDAVLTWSPNPLDFGYVPTGAERVLALTFSNLSSTPVQISNLTATGDYKVRTTQPIEVPATGTAIVEVASKPMGTGPRNARLEFNTNLAEQPFGIGTLRTYGGGPEIETTPVDLGRVAYFAGASPASQRTNRLVVRNVGVRPIPADAKGNLHLGAGALYWTVRATAGIAGNTATVDELCVGEVIAGKCSNAPAVGTYDPTFGLEAMTAKDSLSIPVRVTPSSIGKKEWEVLIYSDDFDEPVSVVAIRANAVALPACDYEISPAALGFGVLTPPNHRDLAVRFHNLSKTAGFECLVHTTLDSQIFSLVPGAPMTSIAVGPDETLEFIVRAQPTANVAARTPISGALVFGVSSPTAPTATVPLTMTVGSSCLLVSDSHYDFGTVQVGCSSGTRSLELYNICSTPLSLTSSTIVEGAGSFSITVPLGGLTIPPDSTAQIVGVRYAPGVVGADRGAIEFQVLEAGVTHTYVTELRGRGDSVGLNVEQLNAPAKADVLFVIDEDLGGYHMNLQTHAAAMLAAADLPLLDAHVGVINMYVNKGKLMGDAANPKVLTGQTPNLVSQLTKRFFVTHNGSGTEESFDPALAALTAPIVNAENAGFLREDATLGIITATRSADQSPRPVIHYHRRLRGLKGAQRAQLFSFSTLGQLPTSNVPTCSYDAPGGDPRGAEMAQLTGGLLEDICETTSLPLLSRVARIAFGHRTAFTVKSIPDLTNGKVIGVKVDGVDQPATAWTFDPLANAVQFEPLFVPARNAPVTITYSVACLP